MCVIPQYIWYQLRWLSRDGVKQRDLYKTYSANISNCSNIYMYITWQSQNVNTPIKYQMMSFVPPRV